MSRRRLTPEEARAWASVTRSVRPLPGVKGVTPATPPIPVELREAEGDPAPGPVHRLAPQSGDTPSTRSPRPADRGRERRVRRGQAPIHGRFDLHGHTQESAARALPAFLRQQQAQGARCVLVITGKGREGEGVLRRNFLLWLDTRDAHALVSGYAQAHPRHGGAGAFYVFVRRL